METVLVVGVFAVIFGFKAAMGALLGMALYQMLKEAG